jgi:hypothetical protein
MFQLIVAVVVIALAAAIAAATLWYGGAAWSHAGDQVRQIDALNRAGELQVESVEPDAGRPALCLAYDAKHGLVVDMPRKQGNYDTWWLAIAGLGVFLVGAMAGAIGGRRSV